jgi:heterotetrameric sarcosine oxidase delta subunit
MRISCPNCGERSVHEFAYRGDAAATRPTTAPDTPIETTISPLWIDYVYLRDNSPGLHRELWYHAGGCRAWLIVTRNVTSHAIARVEAVS